MHILVVRKATISARPLSIKMIDDTAIKVSKLVVFDAIFIIIYCSVISGHSWQDFSMPHTLHTNLFVILCVSDA